MAREYFIRALDDSKLVAKVLERQPRDLQAAVDCVMLLQSIEQSSKRLSGESNSRQVRSTQLHAPCDSVNPGRNETEPRTRRPSRNSRSDRQRLPKYPLDVLHGSDGDHIVTENPPDSLVNSQDKTVPTSSSTFSENLTWQQDNADLRRELKEMRCRLDALMRPAAQQPSSLAGPRLTGPPVASTTRPPPLLGG